MMNIEARYEALRSDFVDSCCHRYVGKGTGRSPLDANRRAQGGAEIQRGGLDRPEWRRFAPATKGGRPVAQAATVELHFRLLIKEHENQVARLNFTLPKGAFAACIKVWRNSR